MEQNCSSSPTTFVGLFFPNLVCRQRLSGRFFFDLNKTYVSLTKKQVGKIRKKRSDTRPRQATFSNLSLHTAVLERNPSVSNTSGDKQCVVCGVLCIVFSAVVCGVRQM